MSEQPFEDLYAVAAETYDHITLYQERPDIPFYVEAAQNAGGTVLEIGCGTGRVLIPIAQAGVEVVGLDSSASMLTVCRHNLAQEPQAVQNRTQLVQGDMRAFELAQTFALITLPFRPFQHLTTVEDQLACLACIHRHLAPGGRLILDLFNPSLPFLTSDIVGQEQGSEPEFLMPDGRRITRRFKIVSRDYFNQVNQTEFIYHITHPDGREETRVEAFPMRYLFRFEAEHLLVRSGFAVEALYSDYTRQPYGAQYPGELIFMARKQD